MGNTLFAQAMEYVPWKTFSLIIDLHASDAGACCEMGRSYLDFAQRY